MLASIQETFAADFMQRALLAGMLVGALCGYLGVYVVLKRIVFVGVALAEMSSAGVALAFWAATILGFAMEEHSPLTMIGALALMLVRSSSSLSAGRRRCLTRARLAWAMPSPPPPASC